MDFDEHRDRLNLLTDAYEKACAALDDCLTRDDEEATDFARRLLSVVSWRLQRFLIEEGVYDWARWN